MSFGGPRRYAPSGVGCTGTTGIVLQETDRVLWETRVHAENKVNGKPNPDAFSMRKALRVPGLPVVPHRWKAEEGGGLDFEELGWDPNGKHALDVDWCLHRKRTVPRERCGISETEMHEVGFALTKPTQPRGVARSASLPGQLQAQTMYEGMVPRLRAVAEKKHNRRLQKFADAEAKIEATIAESGKYLNKGSKGSRWCRGRYITDATDYDNHFIIKNCGVALHQTRPSDEPVLKLKDGRTLAPPWCP
mmetsp:Transcript_132547/g.342979  ORF Transcript_132547/g.342979 Transcript_132547/m.342979 type:complete len:248 (-) Transcript_132547:68-811(-)